MTRSPSLSFSRTRGGRFGALLLAFVALFAVIDLKSAPAAQADTSRRWTIVHWNITNMDWGASDLVGRNYNTMLHEVRAAAANDYGVQLMRTTTNTQRYIEVQVIDNSDTHNNHRLALYLDADTLYLEGYTVESTHYRFSDTTPSLSQEFARSRNLGTPPRFESLGYDSNYNSFTNQTARSEQRFDGVSLWQAINRLTRSASRTQDHVGHQTGAVIAAISEAARFGWIQDRIGNSLRYGRDWDGANYHTHLGSFGVALQNNWAALSRLVYRQYNVQPTTPVTIDAQTYRTVSDVINGPHGNSRVSLSPLIMLGSAR